MKIIKGGGESFDQLCDRSMNALEQIAKKHKGISINLYHVLGF